MRTFVILRRFPGGRVWEQWTAQTAWTRKGAIRKASAGEEPGVDYQAVPARYWFPDVPDSRR